MGFKRKASRVEISRGGRLQRGALSAACKVLNVSETGVRIESRLFVKIGDALQLVIELEQGRVLSCGLQVVHVRFSKFGTKITSISPENRERLTHIFDDHVQTSFSRRYPVPAIFHKLGLASAPFSLPLKLVRQKVGYAHQIPKRPRVRFLDH